MVDKSLVLADSKDSFDYQYQENGDCSQDNLETSIYMALFSNARAGASEISRAELREGFWGEIFGKEFGSKVWLNNGLKTTDNLNRIVDFARKSLKFLVDDGILKAIDVEGSFTDEGVALNVKITYLDDNKENIRIDV